MFINIKCKKNCKNVLYMSSNLELKYLWILFLEKNTNIGDTFIVSQVNCRRRGLLMQKAKMADMTGFIQTSSNTQTDSDGNYQSFMLSLNVAFYAG